MIRLDDKNTPAFTMLALNPEAKIHVAMVQEFDGQTREIAITTIRGETYLSTAIQNTYEGQPDPIFDEDELPSLDHAYARLVQILTTLL